MGKITIRHAQESFLHEYGLPSLADGWALFLLLYARVIEDIPLQVAAPARKKKGKMPPVIPTPKHISGVTVHVREAAAPVVETEGEAEILYEVRWTITDKNGRHGSLWLANCCFVSVEQCDIALNLDTVPIRQGQAYEPKADDSRNVEA